MLVWMSVDNRKVSSLTSVFIHLAELRKEGGGRHSHTHTQVDSRRGSRGLGAQWVTQCGLGQIGTVVLNTCVCSSYKCCVNNLNTSFKPVLTIQDYFLRIYLFIFLLNCLPKWSTWLGLKEKNLKGLSLCTSMEFRDWSVVHIFRSSPIIFNWVGYL